ncbi:apolipoprotein N-acyltransferase [Actinomadura oligospora]|uniref:apolipoprotein N-acyltransferase n=1 Tax=Actinomadura oligospora TaxID=111804 RepID=UPI001B8054E4|nr:apolipoprotein N-acyltransferase [Actinomadura oligospora]
MRSSAWLARALALLAGAFPILAFPRADLGWLAWMALVPGTLLLARGRTAREAALRGWAFGAGYLLAALYWTLPYIGPALPLIALVFGALWAPWGMAARALIPRRPLFALIVLPSAWLTIELARSRPSLGGPWAVYGASQWHHPTELSLAALGGIWLISFALVAANTALTLALFALLRPQPLPTPRTEPVASTPPGPHPASTSPTPDPPPSFDTPTHPTRSPPPHTGAASKDGPGRGTGAASAGGAGRVTSVASDGPAGAVGDGRAAGRRLGAGRRRRNGGRRGFLAGMVGLAVAIAGIGPLVFSMRREPGVARTMRVNLVQPGVEDGARVRLAAAFRMTTSAPRADLTVWGESSVGVDLARDPVLVRRLRELAAARGPLLINEDAADARGRISKSAVLVEPEGLRGRYIKTRLVPFGEYIPFRPVFGWLSVVSKAAGQDRIPGTGPTVMTASGTAFGPLICFESAFPDLARTLTRRGAELIVYQSATSSFQNTWAPAQHASLAAVRAAETGRPTVQAALTGVSAAFDARGRPIAWFDTDRRGVVTVTLKISPVASRTPYDRVGDVVPLVCLLVTAGVIVIAVWKRREEVEGAGATKRR